MNYCKNTICFKGHPCGRHGCDAKRIEEIDLVNRRQAEALACFERAYMDALLNVIYENSPLLMELRRLCSENP